MKLIPRTALLASIWALGSSSLISCSTADDPTLMYEDGTLLSEVVGSLKLSLVAGGQQVNSVTAVISGKHGFQTQTHSIDVSDNNGVISIFFGGLPESRGYSITLTAGQCEGTSSFNIQEDQTTLVNVVLHCPGEDDDDHNRPKETGGVQVTGTIKGGNNPGECDLITKIVASPSVQDGDGPTSTVEVVLHPGVVPSAIAWSSASTTGGAGTLTNIVGTTDNLVSFDCTANGTVFVIANVTAASGAGTCTEQARAAVQCANQTVIATCGNQQLNPGEACDGTLFPAGTAPGSSCNASCTAIIPPTVVTPVCGNGIIQPPEVCDGLALPAGSVAGSTCNSNCSAVLPPTAAVCGNNIIQPPEVCDGSALPAGSVAGSTCNSNCSAVVPPAVVCGNGIIQPPEVCDGSALPVGSAAGSSCNANCSAVIPPVTGICGNNIINPPEVCDGTALPAGTPTSQVCNAGCTALIPRPQFCGDNVITAPEVCDGTGIPAGLPAGTTCNGNCSATVPPTTPVCGNGIIQPPEVCDGAALPAGSAAGSTCNANCSAVIPPTGGGSPCKTCVDTECSLKRNAVTDPVTKPLVDPLLDCVLGPAWDAFGHIPVTTPPLCSTGDLLVCYCGTVPALECNTAATTAVNGPCKDLILSSTGCTSSSCVGTSLLDPTNNSGKALQMAQCEQDLCFEVCIQ